MHQFYSLATVNHCLSAVFVESLKGVISHFVASF